MAVVVKEGTFSLFSEVFKKDLEAFFGVNVSGQVDKRETIIIDDICDVKICTD
jgi:hypothetical protein